MAERVGSGVIRSLTVLLAEARTSGNWGDVRGTADALLALGTCLPPGELPGIRQAAGRWLISKSVEDSNSRNWEQEVWDTSVALMALATQGAVYSRELGEGVRWLANRQDLEQGHWNEEPWETLWALLAISASAAVIGQVVPQERITRSLRWLLGLVGTPHPALLVNWHYTGLFILVTSRYLDFDWLAIHDEHLAIDMRVARDKMLENLRSVLERSITGAALWTKETWSNSIVLWALSENEGVYDATATASFLVSILRNELLRTDLMTEDRAFAVIAGFHLDVCLETTRDTRVRKVVTRLRRDHEDEELRSAVAPLLDLLETRAAEQISLRLAAEIGGGKADFVPRPLLLTRSEHEGFYTVNLPGRLVHIALIVFLTAGVTWIAALADVSSGRMRFALTLIPIGLGALATIAQIANVNVRDLLRRSHRRPGADE